MPRGGKRTGKPGKAYGNRSDLQGAGLSSKQYGDGAARARSTAAVPVAAPAAPAAAPVDPAAPPAPLGPGPGGLGGLLDPSVRPNEPLTAGLPIGPGPGPGALAQTPLAADPDEAALRAIYRAHPSRFLRELIETMEQG